MHPGGDMDDVVAIATLIAERPLCLECVAAKTGVARERILPALRAVERALTLFVRTDGCPECGRNGQTYSLTSD